MRKHNKIIDESCARIFYDFETAKVPKTLFCINEMTVTVFSRLGIWCQNDIVCTSMRRDHVASTLIRRHFFVMCPLGYTFLFPYQNKIRDPSKRTDLDFWDSLGSVKISELMYLFRFFFEGEKTYKRMNIVPSL